ncbi:cation transport protein-domain-containing protein [Microdochium trichocladiopsis]|uniref:Cation transport protein-domain-containing protein n=1 Tax=Microdochium trichocladiopsis TaxID=1682393 RepID=A0A9P8XXN4_9PEZI|nr:cation transport protein-domain-containing protein [Microdochium trichocladiopsis]KAH7020895.1 cation transport protein-domain-containing protein [Microdochium trichocladiopsis]
MRPQWWEDWCEAHPDLCENAAARWAVVRPYLPPVNFITLHYTYFIVTALVGSGIFYGASSPPYSIGWWDSMFMVMSALTASGLNTINVSQLTTFQQAELCLLMIIGSQVLVSYVTIAYRKHVFEKRFEAIVDAERARRKNRTRTHKTGAAVGLAGAMFGLQVMSSFGGAKGREAAEKDATVLQQQQQQKKQGQQEPHATTRPVSRRPVSSPGAPQQSPGSPTAQLESLEMPSRIRSSESVPVGGDESNHNTSPLQHGHRVGFLEPIRERIPLDANGQRPLSAATGHSIYNVHSHPQDASSMRRRPHSGETKLPVSGGVEEFNVQTFLREEKSSIGRNGQFFNLTEEKREYLGGVEYRALKFLSYFVLAYFILWQVFGAIALGAWMSVYAVDTSAVNAQNPWWAGIFLAISAYNNAGFTLLDAGFLPFQSSYFLLTIVAVLSLAGPAAFPVFMRLLIWIMSKLMETFAWNRTEEYGIWKEGFDFILRFPRRVYTSLFPSRDTWLFVATFGGFVMADWFLILILSIGNPMMEAIPLGQRVFDALFEGFSIPSGGYAIFPPASMYSDVLVLWLIIFYTAAYPHIITMRKTNVYEERSLGIYEGDHAEVEQLHSASSSLFDVDGVIPNDDDQLGLPTTANNNWDTASRTPSTRSVKKLYAVGRRGTAFVGRQLQRRMTGFQGVGVASVPRTFTAATSPPALLYTTNTNTTGPKTSISQGRPAGLRRAATIDFNNVPSIRPASVHSLDRHAPTTAPPSLVSQQVRGQLSHDVWWVALALFLVTLIETAHTLEDPVTFSVFNILFEIVSGYTNIGISIGLPDQAYSMTGGMYTGSKIIMILVMLRGRHRGLPVALDRAVKLPAKQLEELEDDDAEIRSNLSGGVGEGIMGLFGH